MTKRVSVQAGARPENHEVNPDAFEVTVCYAVTSDLIWYKSCSLTLGACVQDAIEASGFEQAFREVDWVRAGVGIYGQRCSANTQLNPNDRVEIYRPLVFDPKESRRRRAQHRKKQIAKGARSNGK
ncbi:RnfH family protein [Orrella sp. 11846]|uniref:RnfH family protein n=1 Tax=Orrella sp. 11846 TaxID=3409913 RepID=UPI003B59DF08